MLGLLDRATQLMHSESKPPAPEPLTCEAALKTTALAAALLFAHGQTTERTIIAAARPGRALGVTVRVLPPRPREPSTDVLCIATPFKNSSARSCIQYCGGEATGFRNPRVKR
jgi:hypothetical protein